MVDLQGLAGEVRDREAIRLVREEAVRPFDLAAGPLLRITLLALAGTEHVLLLTAHHIVSDGWSMGLLMGELGTLYGAASRGEPSPLPDLPIQYADFACWQRRWLAGDVLAAELAWWRDRLAGMPVLDLPTDRPRPAVQTARGASFRFPVPENEPAAWAEALRSLAHRARATPFMALLAAFQTLLARYSGQDDVAVGTPVAGRSHRQLEELIGFFVNTLVVRTDLSGEPDFLALLARVREEVLGAFTHQDLSFEKLVEELRPDRDLSRTPLFQAVFTLENAAPAPRELPELRLRPFGVDPGTAKFDLTLVLTESPGGLRAELEYNLDLFDESTVQRLASHFGVLLEALVADPASRVSQLPLLTLAERSQIFAEWNDTAKVCPQIPMVHERFALYAAERPGAIAVASRRHWLAYGEVEARANRLAHHLRTLGVGPEVLVALCTERTPERVIGIVAVLKAGGAYVSLDPTYPKERLAFLLEDAQAPVLLTESRFLATLPDTGATVICLDQDWESLIAGDESRAPASGVGPDNLAYVVYTSGSTGRPKGVEIPHAGLMNLVRWHQDLYGVRPEDRGTQIASPAFDASIWELWPYLAGGASVYIPDEETRLSSPGMLRWWAEEEITLAYLMTPLAEGVLEEGLPPGLPLPTRALIIGGDRLHHRPVPGVSFRLMNHYGPAEYTVTSTVVPVPPAGEGSGIPTIGRPVDNTW
ncbi:MAG TPA: condensation domain-containing protein, partial [Streptosporangiaceae bacterium]|nr:condensation domain-containing protein [Streptosporangiaceae bacterium]